MTDREFNYASYRAGAHIPAQHKIEFVRKWNKIVETSVSLTMTPRPHLNGNILAAKYLSLAGISVRIQWSP